MQLYILRQGDGWALNSHHPEKRAEPGSRVDPSASDLQRRVTDRFRWIARQQGSQAVWLPQSGVLVTQCESEQNRDYPYEDWRDQAIREIYAGE